MTTASNTWPGITPAACSWTPVGSGRSPTTPGRALARPRRAVSRGWPAAHILPQTRLTILLVGLQLCPGLPAFGRLKGSAGAVQRLYVRTCLARGLDVAEVDFWPRKT
jgi:hypothetical protein